VTVTAGVATKVRVETAADGSGTIVPLLGVASGSSITVYAITRDASDNFVANGAATAWSLQNATGGVAAGDLMARGDSKSAVFTGHANGNGSDSCDVGCVSDVELRDDHGQWRDTKQRCIQCSCRRSSRVR